MLAKVYTCAVVGLEGRIIEVEVDISPGLPTVTVVGLGDKAVQESRERVRAAVRNCGCDFPMRRVTVNLAPADLKKEGPAYDLSIAVGVLLSTGQVSSDLSDTVLLGELALDGGCGTPTASSPWSTLPASRGFGASSCRRSTPGRPRWLPASTCSPPVPSPSSLRTSGAMPLSRPVT